MSSSNDTVSNPSPSPPALEVIYENAEMLVVNKPADIPMDGDLGTYPCTVESMVYAYMKKRGIYDDAHARLQQEGKRKKQLKFVHQLDYGTSGVLCLAFTKDMAARLAHCFEMRTTRKYYIALLHGHIPDDTHTGDATARTINATNERLETPLEAWVSSCNDAWHDFGSVRVSACTSLATEDSERALDEFRHLLGPFVTITCETTKTEGGAHQPIAHHRHTKTSSSTTTATPDDGTLRDVDICRFIADTSASFSTRCLTVDLPVGYDSSDAAHFRMAVTTEQSRPANTSLLVLKRILLRTSSDSVCTPVTLVLLAPHTGRRHQLRVHCRAIGFPIVGDTAYCTDLAWCRPIESKVCALTWPPFTPATRMYLHAWRLLLPGAVTSHVSESDRVAMKKKRRRETMGLSERSDTAASEHEGEWTEFVAPVHFAHVQIGGQTRKSNLNWPAP